MAELKLTIPGPPRTKKNHQRIVVSKAKGRPVRRFVLPAKEWEAWAEEATLRIRQTLSKNRVDSPLPDRPYNCAAIFYRDANRGDAVGYYQGLADVLEKAGVVSNDKFIVSWDGSRLLVDREMPRVELVLTEAA